MKRRILVVDDDPQVRKVVRLHLSTEDYDVIEAEDGGKGIQLINEGDNPLEVDAAICDIRMPQINGVEAITYFRKEFPNLPVIVLTGFPDVQMSVDLMKKGVVDYLIKPVTKEKLLGSVRKAIRERVVSPENHKRM